MKKTLLLLMTILLFSCFVQAQQLTLNSPNGNENWLFGSVHPVTWTATAFDGTVRLVLFNGNTKLGPISNALNVAPSSFNWTVGQLIGGTAKAGTNYRIRIVSTDGTLNDFSDAVFTISELKQASVNLLDHRPPMLKFPRLQVTGIGLAPNLEGFSIVFSYKNVGEGPLPRAAEIPVKPDYRVLVDGMEKTKGSLILPAFPAEPGWEQAGYFGGHIVFPTPALLAHMGAEQYQWNIGDSVAVYINENKVLGMDSHSMTRSLKHLALRYKYDLLCTGVTYDWKSHKATFTARLDGKIPANRNLEITWKHDNQQSKETRKITGRLYTFTYKVNPLPEHDSSIWLSAIFQVPPLNDQERIGDIDLRNNSCYQIFRK